jgi:hypothetical protein
MRGKRESIDAPTPMARPTDEPKPVPALKAMSSAYP